VVSIEKIGQEMLDLYKDALGDTGEVVDTAMEPRFWEVEV